MCLVFARRVYFAIFFYAALYCFVSFLEEFQPNPTDNQAMHNQAMDNQAMHNQATDNQAMHNQAMHNRAMHNWAMHNRAMHNWAMHNWAMHNQAMYNPPALGPPWADIQTTAAERWCFLVL